MAQPTTEHAAPATAQAHGTNAAKPAHQAVPILFDDIDPVLLIRLYPDEVNLAGAKAMALAAGKATAAAGATLIAAQQEPVIGAPPPAAAPQTRPPAGR